MADVKFTQELVDEISRLQGELKSVVDLLRSIEWVEDHYDGGLLYRQCPCCRGLEEYGHPDGHELDCKLAKLIGSTDYKRSK